MNKSPESFRLLFVLLISIFAVEIAIMAGLQAFTIESIYRHFDSSMQTGETDGQVPDAELVRAAQKRV